MMTMNSEVANGSGGLGGRGSGGGRGSNIVVSSATR